MGCLELTGWMLSAVGLIEMPVGEMPTRGAPTLMPVAPMLMPAGDVLTKQGLYEKTEPPPEICDARQTHYATRHTRIGDTLLQSEFGLLTPLKAHIFCCTSFSLKPGPGGFHH